MKIVMVSPYPPELDGIGLHARNLVDAIADRATVFVLTRRSRCANANASGAASVERLLSANPSCVYRTVRVLLELDPDVIHYQFNIPALGIAWVWAILAGLAVRHRRHVCLVFTLHEVRRERNVARSPWSADLPLYCGSRGQAHRLHRRGASHPHTAMPCPGGDDCVDAARVSRSFRTPYRRGARRARSSLRLQEPAGSRPRLHPSRQGDRIPHRRRRRTRAQQSRNHRRRRRAYRRSGTRTTGSVPVFRVEGSGRRSASFHATVRRAGLEETIDRSGSVPQRPESPPCSARPAWSCHIRT